MGENPFELERDYALDLSEHIDNPVIRRGYEKGCALAEALREWSERPAARPRPHGLLVLGWNAHG